VTEDELEQGTYLDPFFGKRRIWDKIENFGELGLGHVVK